ARRQGNTFENVATAWYQVKISQNLAPNTIKDIWRSLEKYVFPFIGNTPIDTLTARRFVEVLTPIKERGNLETLKRVLQRVNEVMDYAANSGMIDANPAMNVRKAFPSPVKKHMPTIRPEQLPELMQALSVSATERQTRLLIEWQLLTVTRPVEASSARWEEIDMEAQRWTIPAGRMKMRRDHVIPLCDQAMAVLEAMKPISHHRDYV
ncbi:TPA: tyrosine-type recombinase/integrase, partial [Escherichia coli]